MSEMQWKDAGVEVPPRYGEYPYVSNTSKEVWVITLDNIYTAAYYHHDKKRWFTHLPQEILIGHPVMINVKQWSPIVKP